MSVNLELLEALINAEKKLLALEHMVGGGDDEISLESEILSARAAIAHAEAQQSEPARLTDEQVEHALRTNGAYESDAAYAMAKDGLLTDARAVETAVLRANGFKVDNQ